MNGRMVKEGLEDRSIKVSDRGSQCYMAPLSDVLGGTIEKSIQRLPSFMMHIFQSRS